MTIKQKPDEDFKYDDDVYKWLGRLDRGYTKLETELEAQGGTIRQMAADVREMKESNRTPWSVIIGLLSLTVTIITIVGAMALGPLAQRIDKHIGADGHPNTLVAGARTEERVIALAARLDQQDTMLKSYLTLSIEATRQRIDMLEQMIDYRTSDRYSRSEAEKDQEHMRAVVDRIADQAQACKVSCGSQNGNGGT